MTTFLEITNLLLAVVGVSIVMRLLKQPLIVGYILAGILVGPVALNLVHSKEMLELFSQFGITILLFIVGLHLSPKVIKEVGKVSLITGVGQVVFTSVAGFVIALALDFTPIAALYTAVALTFSSTIIILKLLSDKNQTQTLYGKIAIGFLLVQDIIASFILIVIPSMSSSDSSLVATGVILLFKSLGILVGMYLVMNWFLPAVAKFASKSQEFLFVAALTWGLAMASLFQFLGLSIEIGALLAGVSLSSLSFAEEISSRLSPLRDFFLILFFIHLGSQMSFVSLDNLIIPVIVFSTFILIGNPLIVIILMNLLGYHRRTSYMAGLTVAQISEFSLIVAAIGLQLGHLTSEVLTIITLVGLVTIAGSTYLILYAEKIYPYIEKYLAMLEFKKPTHNNHTKNNNFDIFLFGGGGAGPVFHKLAEKLDCSMAIVDIDPDIIENLRNHHITPYYGDASNIDFLESLPLQSTRLIISNIPSPEVNLLLTKHVRKTSKRSLLIIFANDSNEAEQLYHAGATVVLLPYHHTAKYLVRKIQRVGFKKSAFQ